MRPVECDCDFHNKESGTGGIPLNWGTLDMRRGTTKDILFYCYRMHASGLSWEVIGKYPVRSNGPETKRMADNGKIPPQTCTACKYRNDYAGPEHLQADGSYICRDCPKPKKKEKTWEEMAKELPSLGPNPNPDWDPWRPRQYTGGWKP